MDDLKWREIRNGRLAMVAFLGFVSQHAATGKGPIDNLVEHVAGEQYGEGQGQGRRAMGGVGDGGTCSSRCDGRRGGGRSGGLWRHMTPWRASTASCQLAMWLAAQLCLC